MNLTKELNRNTYDFGKRYVYLTAKESRNFIHKVINKRIRLPKEPEKTNRQKAYSKFKFPLPF